MGTKPAPGWPGDGQPGELGTNPSTQERRSWRQKKDFAGRFCAVLLPGTWKLFRCASLPATTSPITYGGSPGGQRKGSPRLLPLPPWPEKPQLKGTLLLCGTRCSQGAGTALLKPGAFKIAGFTLQSFKKRKLQVGWLLGPGSSDAVLSCPCSSPSLLFGTRARQTCLQPGGNIHCL